MSTTPGPGLYEGVPFDEYLTWQAVNNSSLGTLRQSAAHYRQACDDKAAEDDKPHFQFGRFVHGGRLEPSKVLQNYVVMPRFEDQLEGNYQKPKASKEYREKVAAFRAANAGLEIVTQQQLDDLLGIVEQLAANELASTWLGGEGPAELSMIWEDQDTGLLCKGRVDKALLSDQLAVDLKTTRDLGRFPWSLVDFGYARQAAFYTDGLRALTGQPFGFAIVAMESSAPYCVQAAIVSDDTITDGRLEYRQALRMIADGRTRRHWPGPAQPAEWELPARGRRCADLTCGGQPLRMEG